MDYRTFYLFMFIALVLSACEKVEGCLDPEAVNYEVGADKDCCCEYANLSLQLTPQIGLEPYSTSIPFTDSAGTLLQLTDFRLYLSHFVLVRTDGEEVRIDEEFPATEGLLDDVILLRNGKASYDIGGIVLPEGDYSGIRFHFGLDSTFNDLSPSSFFDHPLAEQDPVMYNTLTQNYLMTNIGLEIIEPNTEPLPFNLLIERKKFYTAVEILHDFSLNRHEPFDIQLQMKLDEFFSKINLLTDDENSMHQKFVNSIENVFSWTP